MKEDKERDKKKIGEEIEKQAAELMTIAMEKLEEAGNIYVENVETRLALLGVKPEQLFRQAYKSKDKGDFVEFFYLRGKKKGDEQLLFIGSIQMRKGKFHITLRTPDDPNPLPVDIH